MSVLAGSILYYIIMTIFDLVMWYAGGFESLGVFDAFFLQDDDQNVSNFIGDVIFEKFEFEEMRDHLLSKLEKIHKCKSKLVKMFGIYWFKEMTPEEWANKKDAIITLVKEEVHNEHQLNKFMADVN